VLILYLERGKSNKRERTRENIFMKKNKSLMSYIRKQDRNKKKNVYLVVFISFNE